ncbi:HAMP domain-containing protein [Epibacterium sp. SM1979]|uniref:histidine kinase n=1 Tax=Tritonibacter litoralis TaxID=2662264 RepID=A0A843YCI9_9RHOB|nr:HAMP domain-containing protein [Tritonibacter litoralis]
MAYRSQLRSAYSVFVALDRWRKLRRTRNLTTFGLVLLGPILVVLTYLIIGPLGLGSASPSLRLVLLADLIYILTIAVLVLTQIVRLRAARRSKSAGSRLHLRLTGTFAFLALVPAIIVAVFAVLSVNVGMEGWFSNRVRDAVGSSLSAAQAYHEVQRSDLTNDAAALARFVENSRQRSFFISDAELREVLAQGQSLVQRGLREAYIIDGSGSIRVRGERSYEFDFERPSAAEINAAEAQRLLIIEDWDNSELRALVPLGNFVDRFLYVSRDVEGDLLNLLDETQKTADLYHQLESDRGRVLFEFGLLYLGFVLILVLAAMWLGMWFAERLSRPVGRLTVAAQRVGAGDLDAKVLAEDGGDEIAQLGQYFNQMTGRLKEQREELLSNTRQIETRRRLFDSVLSSVTSGVVGLDSEGRITFVNRSAERLLGWQDNQKSVAIAVAVPEFGPLFGQLVDGTADVLQEEIKVTRQGRLENLLVRMSPRKSDDGDLEGYVVAFDDVTDLVSAQRMAAWGDVARRIAHEIKNPLTPIQLSAERIKRKFAPKLGEENSDVLQSMTDVIVRQTNDLRRIVDEFSKFARMPEPKRRPEDLGELLRGAVLLQQAGQPDLKIRPDIPAEPLMADLDATMIGQAFTNLIKNAGEAIETAQKTELGKTMKPEIRVRLHQDEETLEVTIADNGIGLPEDRARLFEPYVTTRDEGTGLGLPIVKKIIEEHGGTLNLEDAPVFEGHTHFGAMAVIRLPLAMDFAQRHKNIVMTGLT